jgi:hypothetical protein
VAENKRLVILVLIWIWAMGTPQVEKIPAFSAQKAEKTIQMIVGGQHPDKT